ncbi:type I-E CRISPR-associated protein Cse2/CasB [Streptomyces sp. NPDC042319]|uniref:type I-E CRISPR-associated protein Cse2/CasB n=1 Tax=Streptomyces sp. NPDC042319 TaxID=3154332 RepID=UPI003408AE3E
MTTVTASPTTARERVAQLARQQVSVLQRGYLTDEAKAVAALARLRRGAGRAAGQLPDLWDLVDAGPLHDPMEGARALSESEVIRAQDALHVALTLFAFHQQSRSTGMHQPDRREARRGLGAAVRRMMQSGEVDEPLRKRLVRAGTAPDLSTLAQRLRDIVTLLRREDIALDYGLLAGQLFTWQRPGGADVVRQEWGRSFHAWHDRKPDDKQFAADAVAANAGTADSTSPSDTDKDVS